MLLERSCLNHDLKTRVGEFGTHLSCSMFNPTRTLHTLLYKSEPDDTKQRNSHHRKPHRLQPLAPSGDDGEERLSHEPRKYLTFMNAPPSSDPSMHDTYLTKAPPSSKCSTEASFTGMHEKIPVTFTVRFKLDDLSASSGQQRWVICTHIAASHVSHTYPHAARTLTLSACSKLDGYNGFGFW